MYIKIKKNMDKLVRLCLFTLHDNGGRDMWYFFFFFLF